MFRVNGASQVSALKNPKPPRLEPTNQIPPHGHSLGAKRALEYKTEGGGGVLPFGRERPRGKDGLWMLSGVSAWIGRSSLPYRKTKKTRAYQDTKQKPIKTQDAYQDTRLLSRHKTPIKTQDAYQDSRHKTKAYQDSRQKIKVKTSQDFVDDRYITYTQL